MAGHDKLTPEGKKFFKEIAELKKLQVRVGYQQGKEQSDEGVDMVDIAMFNEVGTARSPERPIIRNSVDGNKQTIEKFCKAQIQKIARGGTAEQVLNAIGSMQKGLIQDTIGKSPSWAKPNADSTIKRKKSDVPLIDTGKMRQSVDYVITPKGGE
jgi:hypothetical protein